MTPRARQAAAAAGIPVVPGSQDGFTSADEARATADAIGYPLLLKASGGGGGRGMRVARDQGELLQGLVSARSEAKAAFGNPAVFLERYIEKPKHIEVQTYRALLESQASEMGARMTAMDAATSNAGEMIDKLTLHMNRVRQASITKEIIEVVSGAAGVE